MSDKPKIAPYSYGYAKCTYEKLEKYERDFYEENKRMVDLPNRLSSEEAEWLNSDW